MDKEDRINFIIWVFMYIIAFLFYIALISLGIFSIIKDISLYGGIALVLCGIGGCILNIIIMKY